MRSGAMATEADFRGQSKTGLGEFLLSHKGDLTLGVSLAVYFASGAVLVFTRFQQPAEIAVSIAEAALIGGLCDYIALKMIFERDRKSTRLNSSHVKISYAVFCLKKKKNNYSSIIPQKKKNTSHK